MRENEHPNLANRDQINNHKKEERENVSQVSQVIFLPRIRLLTCFGSDFLSQNFGRGVECGSAPVLKAD